MPPGASRQAPDIESGLLAFTLWIIRRVKARIFRAPPMKVGKW